MNLKVYQTKIKDAFSYIDPESKPMLIIKMMVLYNISGAELSIGTAFLVGILIQVLDYNKAIAKASTEAKR